MLGDETESLSITLIDALQVYYIWNIQNTARGPVNPRRQSPSKYRWRAKPTVLSVHPRQLH